jgi:hypothetical protein
MYLGVPSTRPGSVNDRSASASRFAKPKSVTSRVPWESTSTFGRLQVSVQHPALVGVVHGPDHGGHAFDFSARIAAGVLRQRGENLSPEVAELRALVHRLKAENHEFRQQAGHRKSRYRYNMEHVNTL